jgi:hypothetical protein
MVRVLARRRRDGARHADVTALDDALAGRPVDRPLRAPLFAALAAQVEELDAHEFMGDLGRRARIYADLARSLRPDVLVVDSGSGWDAEAAGMDLDWSQGFPPSIAWPPALPRPSSGDPGPMVDLLRRVRAVVHEPTLLATTICGPATYTVGRASLADAARITVAYARAVAEAGANIVFVRESEPELPDGYGRAVTPLWGALRFVRAVGVLRAPWAAELLRGPFLPCVTSRVEVPHALAVAPGEAAPADTRAALITHTEDLAGRVPVRELQRAVARL